MGPRLFFMYNLLEPSRVKNKPSLAKVGYGVEDPILAITGFGFVISMGKESGGPSTGKNQARALLEYFALLDRISIETISMGALFFADYVRKIE